MINYSEFLTATVTKDLYLLSDQVQSAFSKFAGKADGYITWEGLMEVIGGEDSEFDISKDTWKKILNDADADGDGKISFDEFVRLMHE